MGRLLTCHTGGAGSGPAGVAGVGPQSRHRACYLENISLITSFTLSQGSILPINLTIGSRVVLLFTFLLMRIYLRSLPTTLSPRLPVVARPGNLEAKSSKSPTENLL